MTTLSAAEIAGYARNAWPADQVATAVAVALAESRGDPDEVHTNRDGSKDFGLWQINDRANGDILRAGKWQSPPVNAQMAWLVWKRQGWSAWSAYKNGSYLVYLPQARVAAGAPAPVSAVEGQDPGGVSGAPDIGKGIGAVLSAGKWFTSPANWLRVVYVIAGVGLAVVGVTLLVGRDVPSVGKVLRK